MENPTNQTHDKQKREKLEEKLMTKRVSENIILFIFPHRTLEKNKKKGKIF